MTRLALALPLALALGCAAKNGPADAAASITPAPAATPGASAPLYVVRDSGKRCIAAPCPSWTAVDVDSRVEREITGVDLAALALDANAADAARQRILGGKVWVNGEIRIAPKQGPAGDGILLVVSKIIETTGAPAP